MGEPIGPGRFPVWVGLGMRLVLGLCEGMWALVRCVAVLGIGLLSCACGYAQEGAFLRVTPPEMDVTATINAIAEEGLPVEAIVIDVCHSGQAIFPLTGAAPPPRPPSEDNPFGGDELLPNDDPILAPDEIPFTVRPGFEDGTRLQAWIDLAHAKGLKVYAGMDLLRWWLPWTADPNPFESHPGLQELNSDLSCEGDEPARYASPWSPVVRASLRALMRELGARYPDLDGLYVECRLSRYVYLGFSDDARVAYIRAARVDPIDIPVFGVLESKHPPLKAWMEWRKEYMTQFLGSVTSAWRETAPDKPVIARAAAAQATFRLRYQSYSCQDWVRWILSGAVNSLTLDVDLFRVKEKCEPEFLAGYAVYEDVALAAPARLVAPGEQRGALLPLAESYAMLMDMELPELALCFEPCTPEQLSVALDLLRESREQ